MRRGLLLVIFVGLSSASAFAQWVPVTAKIKEMRETVVNGKTVEIQTLEGSYYRKSDGSVLKELRPAAGSSGTQRGSLVDHKSMTTYQLDLVSRTAIARPLVIPGGADPTIPPRAPARPASVRHAVVGGVSCAVLPARVRSGPGGTPRPAGEVCISDEFSLLLKNESVQSLPDGRTIRAVFELSDVRTYVEPEESLFNVAGRGFTIYRADQ